MKAKRQLSSKCAPAAFLASAISALAMPGQAWAQEAEVEASADALGEIVVTARKRSESLQDVPVSVSAISGDALRAGYLQDLSDVGGIAPNVVIDPTIGFSNGASISIRGVSFQDIEKSFDPAIGVVVDGVFLGTNSQALLDNFDIERIEVLRGPQGTLFGKNTTGGTINVTRIRPGFTLGGEASYSYSSFDTHDVQAAVNLPLADDVAAARLAVNWRQSDGYLTNTANGERLGGSDIFQFRGALLLNPTEDWEMYLNYDYVADRGDTAALRNASLPTDLFALPGLLGINPFFPGYPADTGPLDEFRSDALNIADYTTHAISMEMNFDREDFTITSITGFRAVDEDVYSDFDAENTANFNSRRVQDFEQLTQELRLTTNWSDRYEFVAGVYYFRSDYDLVQTIDVLTDWIPCNVLPQPFSSFGCAQTGFSGQTTESYAAFIQGNINLGSQFRLTLGGRYTHENKNFYSTPLSFPIGALGSIAQEESWNDFSPRISLDYRPNDDLMLFASYASGFKSGGFNGRAQTITSTGPYDPEKVNTFEFGVRSEWADSRLRVNATTFYTDYQDLQVDLLRTAAGGTGQETVVENAASATIYGFELEVEAVPTEGLRLFGNLGLLHAEYEEFVADIGLGLGVVDNSNLDLRRAPKVTYSVGASYEFPVGDAGNIQANLLYNWQDDLHTTTQNLELGHRQSVGMLSGSIGFSSHNDRWALSVFGRNLTDEFFVTDGIAIGGLVSLQTVSQPRQIGIRLDLRF